MNTFHFLQFVIRLLVCMSIPLVSLKTTVLKYICLPRDENLSPFYHFQLILFLMMLYIWKVKH